jgi:hypothetical protein
MTPPVERYTALLRNLTKPERLERALALSALIRSLAWEGARRDVQNKSVDAVRDRFVIKLYGARTASQISHTIRKHSPNG